MYGARSLSVLVFTVCLKELLWLLLLLLLLLLLAFSQAWGVSFLIVMSSQPQWRYEGLIIIIIIVIIIIMGDL